MQNCLTIIDVARCLGISIPETRKILRTSGLNSRYIAGEKIYHRDDLLNWLSGEFGTLAADKLRNVDLANASNAGLDPSCQFISLMLEQGNIHPWVNANTRASIIRELAAIACESGRIYDQGLLSEQLGDREKVCSTALPVGIAFPHPLDSRKLYKENDLLILARTHHPIPFGEPSGRLTSLFFLLIFDNPSVHLHVLARLNRIVRSTALVKGLIEAETPEDMLDLISDSERRLLSA